MGNTDKTENLHRDGRWKIQIRQYDWGARFVVYRVVPADSFSNTICPNGHVGMAPALARTMNSFSSSSFTTKINNAPFSCFCLTPNRRWAISRRYHRRYGERWLKQSRLVYWNSLNPLHGPCKYRGRFLRSGVRATKEVQQLYPALNDPLPTQRAHQPGKRTRS